MLKIKKQPSQTSKQLGQDAFTLWTGNIGLFIPTYNLL